MSAARVIQLDEEALRRVGRRIDDAWKREREVWIEESLALMAALREGRERFPSDRAFGAWLKDSEHDHWKKDDRAALLAMAGDPARARETLSQTTRRSYQLIWKEAKGRYLNVKTPAKLRRHRPALDIEGQLTAKDRLKVEKAIRLHQAQLDKAFWSRVNEEVHRRIAAADEAMRKQNQALRLENAHLTGLIGQRAVFTSAQFNRLMMCTHPDNSASITVRNEMQSLLVANKRRLVKQE